MNVYNMIYDTYICIFCKYMSLTMMSMHMAQECANVQMGQEFNGFILHKDVRRKIQNMIVTLIAMKFGKCQTWWLYRKPYTLSTQQAHTSVLYDLVVAKNLQIGSTNPRPEVALTSAGFHHDSSTPPISIDGIWWRNPKLPPPPQTKKKGASL